MTLKLGEYLAQGKTYYSARKPKPDGSREEIKFWQSRGYCDMYVDYCTQKLPKIDYGFFFAAQSYIDTNIPECLPTTSDPSQYKLQMDHVHKYSAPYVHLLNKQDFPWFWICTDDRIITRKSRQDVTNLPKEILGQWNKEFTWSCMPSYEEAGSRVKRELVETYADIQKLNMIEAKCEHPSTPRAVKLTVVANQTTYSNDPSCPRFKALKEWVLDHAESQEDIKLIGDWDPLFKYGFTSPELKDRQDFNKDPEVFGLPLKYPQFVGKRKSEEVDEVFKNTRYTLCIPVINGYCTSKYLESLQIGVLPFIPPFYDEQFNAIPQDCFLRVTSPTDMWNKIDYLDKNPDKRIALVEYYQNLFVRPYFNGGFLKSQINQRLEKFNLEPLA
jgi:hypothetical protein